MIFEGLKTIAAIKALINTERSSNITTLGMNRQFTVVAEATDTTPEVKEAQPWVSHWDNTGRIRVTMHEEVCNKIKADVNRTDLLLKYELVPAKGSTAAYHRYVVIIPDSVIATF